MTKLSVRRWRSQKFLHRSRGSSVTFPVFRQRSMESFTTILTTSGFQICIYRNGWLTSIPCWPICQLLARAIDILSHGCVSVLQHISRTQNLKGVLLFKILASRLAHEHEPLEDDGLPDPAAAIPRVTTIPVSLPVLGYTSNKIEPRFRGGGSLDMLILMF